MSLKINTVYGRRHSKLFTNCHVTHVQTIPSSEKRKANQVAAQFNTVFRKKQDPVKIVLLAKWQTTRNPKKHFFFFFSKLAEI